MTLSRSTPMRRTGFKTEQPSTLTGNLRRLPLSTAHFAAKPKKCAHCKEVFTPKRPNQKTHEDCAWPYVQAQNAKKREAAKKVERKADKEKIAALRPLSWHKKQAQAAVNAFVRARDAHLPCISCRRSDKQSWDAGHYRSRGSAAHLALDPRNVHRQCVQCNQHLHGNHIEFRIGLIARYGLAYVEALECDQSTKKYTAAEFDAIAADFRAKTRALQKETA